MASAGQRAGERIEQLIEGARRETGLDDFGGESFREGLGVLVEALLAEARLHAAGEQAARGRLGRLLANRLRITDWYARHPEVEDERTPGPIFVVGLPRTGTTALGQLLAQDPETRPLRSWECGDPVPPPETAALESDPRIARTEQGMAAMHAAFPELRIMYDADAHATAEDQDLLGLEFKTEHFGGQYRIPSYSAWLLDCDMVPAYRMHQRTLKLLQSRCPPNRWLVKSPVDLLFLDALDAVYPDARFVMTHRDPAAVLASVCSLISVHRRMGSDELDPAELGRAQLEVWEAALQRGLRFRDRVGEARFADLPFGALQREPVDAIARAYATLGIPFTDLAREQMQKWSSGHQRGRHGKHRYRLEDWGLDPDAVHERFAFYTDRFSE